MAPRTRYPDLVQGAAEARIGKIASAPKTALRAFDQPRNPRLRDRPRKLAPRLAIPAHVRKTAPRFPKDANGNLETVTDPLGGVTTFVYDSVDRLTEKHLPNGVVSTYGYDDRDRVLSVTHTGASGVLASVTYVRSASGEPTRITREDGSYVVLTYDAALRLDTETYYTAGGGVVDAIDYDYDLDGNRTRKTSLAGGVEDYAYSAGFKLDSVTHSGSTDTFGYDGGGRVTGINRDGSTQSLEYNSDDKITHVSGGSTDVRYSYDGVGRRVGKTEGGVSTRYLIAPNLGDGFESPQAVTDGSGAMVATFVYAGEHPIARITPTGVEYFLADGMGSVIGKADSSGNGTASIKYDGFGNVTSSVGVGAGIDPALGSEPRFQGMSLDSVSGLYFVRARTYDARTGRFLSRDPVAGMTGRPETMNPHVFANNNPFRWRDPSGRDFGEFSAISSALSNIALSAMPTFKWAFDQAGTNVRSNTSNDPWTVKGVSTELRGGPSGWGFLQWLDARKDLDVYAFDTAVDEYLLPGDVHFYDPLDGLRGNYCDPNETPQLCPSNPRIRIRSDVTNRRASLVLYHESRHYLGVDEIEARLRTEYFAVSMGWSETEPGYQVPQGIVNENYIAVNVILSPHYNPTDGRIWLGRNYIGEHEVSVSSWSSPP